MKMESIDEATHVKNARCLLIKGDYKEFLNCVSTLKHRFDIGAWQADGRLDHHITALRSCLSAAMDGLSGAIADHDEAKLTTRADIHTRCHRRV